MKLYKNLSPIILSLALSTLYTFASSNNFGENPNNTSETSQCTAQDTSGLFVLEALFSNPENPYPIELWENRDNEQINIFYIAREIKSIANLKEKVFNNTDESKRTQLFARLSQMEDIADRALLMEADKWKASYVNELMKHIIGIRNAGVSDLLPRVVDAGNCKETDKKNTVNPCDETGQHWTTLSRLTDPKHQGPSIANYMLQHEADIELIRTWWNMQMSSSWLNGCLPVKIFYSNQRTLDPKGYYWGEYSENNLEHFKAKLQYEFLWEKKGMEESYTKALTIWHAYVQEVLSKTKFNYNNQTDKKVCLVRSNGLDALQPNNINEFGKDYTMPNAVYESFSLINIVVVSPDRQHAITESLVPHHRIIHLYPLLHAPLIHQTEFVVLSGPDLPFDYFYNTDEDLSFLQERLENGEGACKGYKLTGTQSD